MTRQHFSGDKQRLLGIPKRGDPYLRMLLVHGARSVVYRISGKRILEADGGETAEARNFKNVRCGRE